MEGRTRSIRSIETLISRYNETFDAMSQLQSRIGPPLLFTLLPFPVNSSPCYHGMMLNWEGTGPAQ